MTDAAPGIFVTGTDTGVGKTFVGCLLVEALRRRGLPVAPRKPVETGCAAAAGGYAPSDAWAYWCACGGEEPLAQICTYRFAAAASPERAASLTGAHLSIEMLVCASAAQGRLRVVEGAGGFYSPIAERALNADLAQRLGLPILLVVADRLGCVNHTLLTAEAIRRCGLDLLAVVLNTMGRRPEADLDNAGAIRAYLDVPLFELAAGKEVAAVESVADLLLGRAR